VAVGNITNSNCTIDNLTIACNMPLQVLLFDTCLKNSSYYSSNKLNSADYVNALRCRLTWTIAIND